MRILAICTGLLLAGLGTWMAMLGAIPRFGMPGGKTPELQVTRTEHDFGTVTSGEWLETSFTVRNQGRRRLVLVAQSASCECLHAGQPELIIPPGCRQDVIARIDTRRTTGSLRMTLTYWTNDPSSPQLEFVLLADIAARPAHSFVSKLPN